MSKTGCGLIVAPVDDLRPAHLRLLPRVPMAEQTARFFLCACCCEQVLVCRRCDRGQRYCAGGCAATTRCALQRACAQRYQRSRAGRFKHALRTRCWRARQVALAKIVTHQGSHDPSPDVVLPATQTTTLAAQPCTTTKSISTPTAMYVHAWRCHWCCTPCAALVRQGFLRHSTSQTTRHGHSP